VSNNCRKETKCPERDNDSINRVISDIDTSLVLRGRRGRDRMVVGSTITYVTSAYHY